MGKSSDIVVAAPPLRPDRQKATVLQALAMGHSLARETDSKATWSAEMLVRVSWKRC